MALMLVIVFILGLLLLVPSLILLLRLFIFDADYVKGKNNIIIIKYGGIS